MSPVEWVRLTPELVLVARADRAFLHRLGVGFDPFKTPMTGSGSHATTAQLLDGAIGAARRGLTSQSRPMADLTVDEWAWELVGYFHLTHHTPRLLGRAAAAFQKASRPALVAWAVEKGRDEAGHDQLALKDLRALGFDADALVAAECPARARRMIDRFEKMAQEIMPLGVVGYAHTVERLGTTFGAEYVAAIQATLPVDATRCLRVHSGVGSEAGHITENVNVITRLAAIERSRVALVCWEISRLFFSPCNDLGSEQRIKRLDPFRI